MWVTLTDAAAMQRPPVSKQAVSKRVKALVAAGRLATKAGPRGSVLINIVAFNRAVAEETDPAQALRNGRAPVELLFVDEDVDDEAAPIGITDASYHSSRAKREAYQAENARLNLAERLEELVKRDDAEARTMEVFRRARDRFLMLPTRIAERLAAAPDARAVKSLLSADIRKLLDGLADELDHLAEAGDEDDGELFDSPAGAERSDDQEE